MTFSPLTEPFISDNPFRLLSLDALTPLSVLVERSAAAEDLVLTSTISRLQVDRHLRTMHRVIWYSGAGIHIGKKWIQFLETPANTQLLKTILWDLNNFRVNDRLVVVFAELLQAEEQLDEQTAEAIFRYAVRTLSEHIVTRALEAGDSAEVTAIVQASPLAESIKALTTPPILAASRPQVPPVISYDLSADTPEVTEIPEAPRRKRLSSGQALGSALGLLGVAIVATLTVTGMNRPLANPPTPTADSAAASTAPSTETPAPSLAGDSSESELGVQNSFLDNQGATPEPFYLKSNLEAANERLQTKLNASEEQLKSMETELLEMKEKLSRMSAEITRKRPTVNRRSSSAVSRFNVRVRAYNNLRQEFVQKVKEYRKRLSEQNDDAKNADAIADRLSDLENESF